MKKATTDPSKRLDLYLRINRNGIITFTFLDSVGLAYDVSGLDFELFVKQNPGTRKDVISLLTSYSGFGLTFPTSNILLATFTDSITEINEGEYYWELLVLDTNKTWLSGKAFFYNGEFDGVDSSTSITVNDGGDTIEISIHESGTSYNVSILSVATTSGTITFDFGNQVNRKFVGATSFATPKTIAYSNSGFANEYRAMFDITNVAAVLTFPGSTICNAAGWDSTGKTWTPTYEGKYKFKADFDGTNWWLEVNEAYS